MSKTPKCPYCGDKMELIIVSPECINGTSTAWYQCVVCESSSPTSEGPANAPRKEIVKKALALAMHRAETKNRVMTLEEVVRGKAMWYEERTRQVARVVILGYAQNEPGFTKLIGYLANEFYRRDDTYNVFWRCWLRKPTKEEMEGTPWEGDAP